MPHSTPSSVSSTYSPLPTTAAASAGYYTLSPSGQGFGLSASSLSGQSSPSVLFSPAISTPGMGYSETALSTEGSTSNLDLNAGAAAVRQRKTRPRGKTTTGAGPTRRPSTDAAMALKPPPLSAGMHLDAGAMRPEKRRKSEPEPEEFKQVGLGVTIGGSGALFPLVDSPERPKVRRTASDGQVLTAASTMSMSSAPGTGASEWSMRSPTPPPLPSLPLEHQEPPPQQQVLTNTPEMLASAGPSSAAALFAATVIAALSPAAGGGTSRNDASHVLQAQLGLGPEELESMRTDFATMFDRWRLEKGMSRVSLEDKVSLSGVRDLPTLTVTADGQGEQLDGQRDVDNVHTRFGARAATTPPPSARGQYLATGADVARSEHVRHANDDAHAPASEQLLNAGFPLDAGDDSVRCWECHAPARTRPATVVVVCVDAVPRPGHQLAACTSTPVFFGNRRTAHRRPCLDHKWRSSAASARMAVAFRRRRDQGL